MSVSTGDPAREAERIRNSFWTRAFPVDPVLIAQRLGVSVRQAKLSPGVSGALVKNPGEDPTILLNANDHPNRQRFTCAHELGHYISRENDPDAYEYVDLRDIFRSAAGTKPEEIFANAFAANLLMPEREVQRLLSEKHSPTEMAAYFDVSQDSMHFRLQNLKRS